MVEQMQQWIGQCLAEIGADTTQATDYFPGFHSSQLITHYKSKGAASGFEMCFAIGSQPLGAGRSQPNHAF
jgi:hypothetical protein